MAASVYIPSRNAWGFQFLHILTNTCNFLSLLFKIVAIPVGVKRYLTVILLCISLMTSDIEHCIVYYDVLPSLKSKTKQNLSG